MRRSLYLQCHKIMIQYWVVKLYNFDVGASCTSEGFGCFARSISSNSMPLSFKVARWQNLIPSFPWIAPGWRAWGAIQGKEGIKFCSVA